MKSDSGTVIENDQRKVNKLNVMENDTSERSIKLNILEGGFFGAMNGLTQNFLIPFALLFGGSNFFISLVATLPGLVGSIAQLLASQLMLLVKSARRYMVLALLGHAFVFLLLALLPFFVNSVAILNTFFFLILLGAVFSFMISPVWITYVGELIPVQKRAYFFARRNVFIGLLAFITMLLAGLILFFVKGVKGFAILFFLAALFRIGSAWCIKNSKEISISIPNKNEVTIGRFLKRIQTSDFGRFVSLAVFLRFVAYLATPFFIVYELKVLNFNYLLFTGLQLATVLSSIISMRYWARFADQRGNRRIIIYTSIFIGIVPLLWLTTKVYFFLLLFELFSGLAWGGFNLASSNYMLEATNNKVRSAAISYFNLFNQLAIIGGSILGSGLLALFGRFSVNVAVPFLILFAVSGLLRLLVVVLAKPRIRELRFVEIPVKRGHEMMLLDLLPKQGVISSSSVVPGEEVRSAISLNRHLNKEFKEFEVIGVPKGVLKRMKPHEKELYRSRFIERATGKSIKQKPRGIKSREKSNRRTE